MFLDVCLRFSLFYKAFIGFSYVPSVRVPSSVGIDRRKRGLTGWVREVRWGLLRVILEILSAKLPEGKQVKHLQKPLPQEETKNGGGAQNSASRFGTGALVRQHIRDWRGRGGARMLGR